MKLSSVCLLPLVALLPSFVAADGAAIVAAIGTVTDTATKFNETVAGFDGGITDILKILAESTELLGDIKSGTQTARRSANLTDTEALALVGPTTTLVQTVQDTLNTTIRKKPVFARTLTQIVALGNLKAEKAASDDFSAAILAKVSPALRPIAASLVAPLDPAFDRAIDVFEDFF